MIVRLSGGLGNQLFQLGAALYLSNLRGYSGIYLDVDYLGLYSVPRELELYKILNIDNVVKIRSNIVSRLRLPVHFSLNVGFWPFISDSNFVTILNYRKRVPVILDGYFQSCLSQNDFDSILSLLKMHLINKCYASDNVCVVHVRGSDFIALGWDSLASKEYYIKAINIMRDKYKIQEYIVVTDDKEYAESLLSGFNCKITIKSEDMLSDFNTISSYKMRILSASTFALWASALGNNAIGGAVFSPALFTPGVVRGFKLPNEVCF